MNNVIQNKFAMAPKLTRDLLLSEEYQSLIAELGEKYSLPEEDIQVLADEIEDIMIGITKPSEFIKKLEKYIGITHERAVEIAKELQTRLFSVFKEELKVVHFGTTQELPPQPTTTQGIAFTPGVITPPKWTETPPAPQSQNSSIVDQKLSGKFGIPEEHSPYPTGDTQR